MKFSIHSNRKVGNASRLLLLIVLLAASSVGSLAMSPAVAPRAQASERMSAQGSAEELPMPAPAVVVSDESLAEADSGSLGYGVRAAGAMIVVLALIWITMILLKRYMPHRFGPLGHKRRIQVLETVPIGEKRTLTLIRIDNEELLLAGTPGSLSLLKEIRLNPGSETPAQAEDPIRDRQPASDAGPRKTEAIRKFEDVLADQVQAAAPASAPAPGPLSRLTLLRQQLEAR